MESFEKIATDFYSLTILEKVSIHDVFTGILPIFLSKFMKFSTM